MINLSEAMKAFNMPNYVREEEAYSQPLVQWYLKHEDVQVPVPHSPGSAGIDLRVFFQHLLQDSVPIASQVHLESEGEVWIERFEVPSLPSGTVLKRKDGRPFTRVKKGDKALIPTGLTCIIHPGYEMQIRPRSSIIKQGFTIVNSPGTIDSDYRGEIFIAIKALEDDVIFMEGDRIAQGVFCQIPTYTYTSQIGEASKVHLTERGEKGFGSTGK